MPVTCRIGPHLSGKLAADTVVVGADVVKTPASELLGAVELSRYKAYFVCICGLQRLIAEVVLYLHLQLFFVNRCCTWQLQ